MCLHSAWKYTIFTFCCFLCTAYTGAENVPFVVTSIIIFIVGFMSGRYLRLSERKLPITTTDQPQQGPLYDYAQPSIAQHQENLELKVNMDYQPSKSITVVH